MPLTFGDIQTSQLKQHDFQDNFQKLEAIPEEILSLDKAMVLQIQNAMAISRSKVEGKCEAAEFLQINPRTLRHRMKKIGVSFGRTSKKAIKSAHIIPIPPHRIPSLFSQSSNMAHIDFPRKVITRETPPAERVASGSPP
jgi:hypothetical protein